MPLVEGIDNLQVEYGIDTNNDGTPDLYSAEPGAVNSCTTAPCVPANWRNVVAVKLNVLARSTEATLGFVDNKSYTLGNLASGAPNIVAAAGDNIKRHVFQAVVNLPNPAGRKIP